MTDETAPKFPEDTWHALPPEDILTQLATPPDTGLSAEQAAQRLAKYGPNQLTEAPRPSFL